MACEAIANAIKHGHATQAIVTVTDHAHQLQLVVTDDGSGWRGEESDRTFPSCAIASQRSVGAST